MHYRYIGICYPVFLAHIFVLYVLVVIYPRPRIDRSPRSDRQVQGLLGEEMVSNYTYTSSIII